MHPLPLTGTETPIHSSGFVAVRCIPYPSRGRKLVINNHWFLIFVRCIPYPSWGRKLICVFSCSSKILMHPLPLTGTETSQALAQALAL